MYAITSTFSYKTKLQNSQSRNEDQIQFYGEYWKGVSKADYIKHTSNLNFIDL